MVSGNRGNDTFFDICFVILCYLVHKVFILLILEVVDDTVLPIFG